MHQDILERIGLTPNEAKIYETLLEIGTSSTYKLAIESKVHRSNVYDSLDKLMQKGLVTKEFVSKTVYVRAVNPLRLLDIVREREAEINSILPALEKKFQKKPSKEEAVIYRGIEGFKNHLKDILEENQTVYFIGAKGLWLDERLKYFLPNLDRQRIKQKIRFKHLYDWEVKKEAPEILKLKMNEYRFLPRKYSSSIVISIFGSHVVIYSGVSPGHLPKEPVQYTVVNQKIAEGFKKYFELLWNVSNK